ncbi:serine/threonine-protein kinase [Pseudonocardia kunmingensis]|uniref:non-specific serine/threonine protein kinase n=1 Tax=Pseudonocardia kunmingensis TaxID=630975 RepID=A0A543D393_9PSEU|nr:serine/threonine-protein kinase [Pseudonocardia kunmingensis]TQM03810.1 protein kinase-like protein [Pseudonocardia kunmingensis]
MDALTALVAGLVASLRAGLAADVCPGGWPWAVSALGIGVGLLPTAGAVGVVLLRKRIGSRYGAGESVLLALAGLVSAGLLPLVAFTATGRVFRAAALGRDVPGLTDAQVADLGTQACGAGPQSTYLGGYSVAAAFDPSDPLRFGLAVVLLVGFPLVAALFVAAQARLALRRGPSWPAKFFWLPALALTVLTARTPAGSSGHLWIGVATGAFLGIAVVLMAGTPSREVVRRSLAAPAPRPPARRPEPSRRPLLRRDPAPPVSAPPRPPAQASPAPGVAAQRSWSDRMAERFAARTPEPPVVPQPRTAAPALAPQPGPVPPRAQPPAPRRPTLVAPAPPGAGAPVPGGARFRLVRRLGSGGFGRVWLAHDARLGHPVALKAAHAPDTETEERIRREARALAAVRHPHCVRIHDLVPAASDPGLRELEGMVIVMEYVEGASLGDLVRTRGVLDDVAAARVWSGIAGALDAAHARSVMHRDVKPGNVVVDQAGLAHLIDFGIARRTGDSTMTMAGFVLGTPDFLAPEVACGERATPASDAWQLGATISYALTGHPPRGGHPDAVSGLRAAAVGAPLTHLPQGSAHLALLRAAMDTDPRRRPSMRTVQGALEEWLRRAGVRPDGPVTAGARVR